MKYEEFLRLIKDENRPFNYYFAEQAIPEPLQNDVILPQLG